MVWTEERLATLKIMWDAGRTATEIAEALGDISRNSVIGKAHRLGFRSRSLEDGEEKKKRMSSLRVRQVRASLSKMFGDLVDTSDLQPNDKQFDLKLATRELAAFAVLRATGCTPDEAARAITDGAHDNGIDALFHDASASEVIAVQAKWAQNGTGEPSSRDIGQFVEGVKAVVEQDLSDFRPALHGKIVEIADAMTSVGTTVKMIVISTGSSVLANPASNRLQRLIDELNGADDVDKIASFEVVGLSEVYRDLAAGAEQGSIDVDLNILDWSYVPVPVGAYFGTVDGAQLKTLWAMHGKRLVAKNIRHGLGSTEVNDAIRQTATTEPDKFWYYNNGITFVAEEARRAPANSASQKSGVFQFAAASIVNGAQTVSTLATVDDDESLGKVRVGVRVIMLKDTPEDFGGSVTRTNNLQNRIEGRDFVAQDPEQIRLQSEMAMEGIEYQYLRGDTVSSSETSCELIEVVTALACATGDASMAVIAKTAVGRFFADIRRAPYKTIFNSSLTGARAFNAVLFQREIDKLIDNRRKALERKSGSNFGVLVHRNRVLSAAIFRTFNPDLDQIIDTFKQSLDLDSLSSTFDRLVDSFVAVVDRDYQNKFLAVLFKSPTKSKILMESALDLAAAA